jgi:prepilin-type N-terminal cleavage/methylation domain-containing protein
MNSRGFTLIEILVAISILTVGALAAMRLMARSENIAHISRQQFVGLSVAREGLELVRDLRDTNWFSQDDEKAWANTLCPDGGEHAFTLDAAMVRAGTASVGDVQQPELYIQENGEWAHQVSRQDTGFSRTLTVDCSHYLDDDPAPQYITVTSHVSWKEGETQRVVDLKEKLFNWYIRTTKP